VNKVCHSLCQCIIVGNAHQLLNIMPVQSIIARYLSLLFYNFCILVCWVLTLVTDLDLFNCLSKPVIYLDLFHELFYIFESADKVSCSKKDNWSTLPCFANLKLIEWGGKLLEFLSS
jgi:hypothetical protein